jgi:hypothetical protein
MAAGRVVGPPPAVPISTAPPAASRPTNACSLSQCQHRTQLGRRLCKRKLQEKFLGFPEEFERPALGAAVYTANNIQVNNGMAARLTLYQYDFVEGSNQLSPRGRDQLAKIAALLPLSFSPVVIERTLDEPGLADARRAAVLAELGRGLFPVPAERVVVAAPAALGLRGIEADLTAQALLMRTSVGSPSLDSSTSPGPYAGATQTISTLGSGGGPR